MTTDEKIREAIKGFQTKTATVLQGVVTAVDEDAATCKVDLSDNGSLIIEDVRLRSTIDGKLGLYAVPAEKSSVILLRIGLSDEFFIAASSTFQKVVARGESVSMEMTDNLITFNDGAKDSYMTDINELVSKINSLESCLNDLKTVFSAWVPVPMDGGAVLKAAVTTWASQVIAPLTTVNDLKDSTIKH